LDLRPLDAPIPCFQTSLPALDGVGAIAILMGVETGLLGRSLTYESMETLESAATYGAG